MSEAGGQCVGGRCVLQSRAVRPACLPRCDDQWSVISSCGFGMFASRAVRPACLPGASQKAEIGKAESRNH